MLHLLFLSIDDAHWILDTDHELHHGHTATREAMECIRLHNYLNWLTSQLHDRLLAIQGLKDMLRHSGAKTMNQLNRWIRKVNRRKTRTERPKHTWYQQIVEPVKCSTKAGKHRQRARCIVIADQLQSI